MTNHNDIIESMDENLQSEFETYFPNGEPDPNSEVDVENMRTYVEGFTQIPMQGSTMGYLNLTLYRARYDDGFPKTEISQYGYKPDAIRGSICRLRYNLPKEQVLYTSTYPLTAFREIEDATKGCEYFYLSVWTKKANSPAPMVYPVVPNNPQQLKERALQYYKALKGHIASSPLTYRWQSRLGGCLEATSHGGMNNGYLMSSTIASRLFRENDVLLTVSQKSDNSELNITYNHTAYDFVQLNTVFHCKCPAADKETLLFDVDEIGIVNNGAVEWHKYEIDVDTICYVNKDLPHIQMAATAKKILSTPGTARPKIKMSVQHIATAPHYFLMYLENGQNICFIANIKLG